MGISNDDKYKSAKWKYVNYGNIFSQEKKKTENRKVTLKIVDGSGKAKIN